MRVVASNRMVGVIDGSLWVDEVVVDRIDEMTNETYKEYEYTTVLVDGEPITEAYEEALLRGDLATAEKEYVRKEVALRKNAWLASDRTGSIDLNVDTTNVPGLVLLRTKIAKKKQKTEGKVYPNTDYMISFTKDDGDGMLQVQAGFEKYGLTKTVIHFSNGTKMPIVKKDFTAFARWFVTERARFFDA